MNKIIISFSEFLTGITDNSLAFPTRVKYSFYTFTYIDLQGRSQFLLS